MFRIFFIKKILNSFDYFQQKKIFNFLKKKLKEKAILIDVGAHHGETITNFINNFRSLEIHSFEASPENFKILSKKFKHQKIPKVIINDYGLSNENKELSLYQFSESSSSTLSKINKDSKYFQRKLKILGLNKKDNIYKKLNVKLGLLDDYLNDKKIEKIDLLKIDTEGHEYYVLKGSKINLKKIRFIYFEHHYDNMLNKGYTFSEINNFLVSNNFRKVFKSKMYFRKTFEYIYENSIFK